MNMTISQLSFEDVLILGLDLIESEGLTPMELVDKHDIVSALDDDALRAFARIGLAKVVGSELSRQRTTQTRRPKPGEMDDLEEQTREAVRVLRVAVDPFLVAYRKADGSMAPLYEFNDADMRVMDAHADGDLAGAQRWKAFTEEALAELERHKGKPIIDLPVKSQKRLRELLEERAC